MFGDAVKKQERKVWSGDVRKIMQWCTIEQLGLEASAFGTEHTASQVSPAMKPSQCAANEQQLPRPARAGGAAGYTPVTTRVRRRCLLLFLWKVTCREEDFFFGGWRRRSTSLWSSGWRNSLPSIFSAAILSNFISSSLLRNKLKTTFLPVGYT